MARETNCPICHKMLIGGQCPDCGYYVDTHTLASDINDLDVNAGHLCESHNGGNDYNTYEADAGHLCESHNGGNDYNTYEADAGHLCESHNGEPSIKIFSANERDAVDMSKSDQQIKKEHDFFIMGVIFTMIFPIWGYILSQTVLTSIKANPKYKKKLKIIFVVTTIIQVIMFVGSIIPYILGIE